MKKQMVKIGNFFFTYRNRLFPVIILALYLFAIPPAELFGSETLENIKDVIAVLISLSGLVIRGIVIGYAYIKRGGVGKKVYADTVVKEGMFALCRNPLYLGNILIYIGVFLAHGAPLVVILGIGTFLFIYQCLVFAEENYLENKFGAPYMLYCSEVPRWIPDLSKFKQATEGMSFNFKRVILKDYTTIATTLIALAITEGYEVLAERPYPGFPYGMLSVIVLSGVWIAVVRYFKKRPLGRAAI